MKRSEILMSLLENLRGVYDEGPEGRDAVDQLEHCLQMGTRAKVAGLTPRFIGLAVVHDAFRVLSPFHHGEALSITLNDVLTSDEKAILAHHSGWQADVVHGTNIMDEFRDESWYARGCLFGELDAKSFDPNYMSAPLEFFRPYIEILVD